MDIERRCRRDLDQNALNVVALKGALDESRDRVLWSGRAKMRWWHGFFIHRWCSVDVTLTGSCLKVVHHLKGAQRGSSIYLLPLDQLCRIEMGQVGLVEDGVPRRHFSFSCHEHAAKGLGSGSGDGGGGSGHKNRLAIRTMYLSVEEDQPEAARGLVDGERWTELPPPADDPAVTAGVTPPPFLRKAGRSSRSSRISDTDRNSNSGVSSFSSRPAPLQTAVSGGGGECATTPFPPPASADLCKALLFATEWRLDVKRVNTPYSSGFLPCGVRTVPRGTGFDRAVMLKRFKDTSTPDTLLKGSADRCADRAWGSSTHARTTGEAAPSSGGATPRFTSGGASNLSQLSWSIGDLDGLSGSHASHASDLSTGATDGNGDGDGDGRGGRRVSREEILKALVEGGEGEGDTGVADASKHAVHHHHHHHVQFENTNTLLSGGGNAGTTTATATAADRRSDQDVRGQRLTETDGDSAVSAADANFRFRATTSSGTGAHTAKAAAAADRPQSVAVCGISFHLPPSATAPTAPTLGADVSVAHSPDTDTAGLSMFAVDKLLSRARQQRAHIEMQLVGAITMREKLLERVHYLQALKRIAKHPPPSPTRHLGPVHLPSIDQAVALCERMQLKMDSDLRRGGGGGGRNDSVGTSAMSVAALSAAAAMVDDDGTCTVATDRSASFALSMLAQTEGGDFSAPSSSGTHSRQSITALGNRLSQSHSYRLSQSRLSQNRQSLSQSRLSQSLARSANTSSMPHTPPRHSSTTSTTSFSLTTGSSRDDGNVVGRESQSDACMATATATATISEEGDSPGGGGGVIGGGRARSRTRTRSDVDVDIQELELSRAVPLSRQSSYQSAVDSMDESLRESVSTHDEGTAGYGRVGGSGGAERRDRDVDGHSQIDEEDDNESSVLDDWSFDDEYDDNDHFGDDVNDWDGIDVGLGLGTVDDEPVAPFMLGGGARGGAGGVSPPPPETVTAATRLGAILTASQSALSLAQSQFPGAAADADAGAGAGRGSSFASGCAEDPCLEQGQGEEGEEGEEDTAWDCSSLLLNSPGIDVRHLRQRTLGAPPKDLSREFERVMRTLEALWLCELESFEAIQTFTATLHQREHTWQQLKFYEEGISTTKFEVPKETELYDIAL